MDEQQPRRIQTQACATVARLDSSITPIEDQVWRLYPRAALAFTRVVSEDSVNAQTCNDSTGEKPTKGATDHKIHATHPARRTLLRTRVATPCRFEFAKKRDRPASSAKQEGRERDQCKLFVVRPLLFLHESLRETQHRDERAAIQNSDGLYEFMTRRIELIAQRIKEHVSSLFSPVVFLSRVITRIAHIKTCPDYLEKILA